LVRYEELEFFINLDQLIKPEFDGYFLEIKSRTWSRRDAEHKARLVRDILDRLGVEEAEPIRQEYPDVITAD
ncbi:MAG: amidohydrolase, partial [Anaerolineales bacterium]